MVKYYLDQIFPTSWHLKADDVTIAHIEGVDKRNSKGHVEHKGFLRKVPVQVYAITSLAGAPDTRFHTVTAAAQAAINHYSSGGHLTVQHPLHKIKKRIANLDRAISQASSDHRITDDQQEGILDVSRAHAQTKKAFKGNFD